MIGEGAPSWDQHCAQVVEQSRRAEPATTLRVFGLTLHEAAAYGRWRTFVVASPFYIRASVSPGSCSVVVDVQPPSEAGIPFCSGGGSTLAQAERAARVNGAARLLSLLLGLVDARVYAWAEDPCHRERR